MVKGAPRVIVECAAGKGMTRVKGGRIRKYHRLVALVVAAVLWSASLFLAGIASATEPRRIFSPIVEEGEAELEFIGTVEHDRKPALNGGQAYIFGAGYGVTSFWMTEFEGELKSDPGGHLKHEATEWENTFQVTPQGKYWLDLGVFAEYEIAAQKTDADEITFGPILQKEFYDWLATLNVFFDKQVGSNASGGTSLVYAAQLRYRWKPWLEPAIEAFGEPGPISDFKPGAQQTHLIGPAVVGRLPNFGLSGELKYEVGHLFGLTPGSAQGAVRWKLEYEFRF